MKLGLTQYAASADGRGFVEAAARFKVAGVEPFIADVSSEFLAWSNDQIVNFVANARRLGVEVPSVALGVFNNDASLIEKNSKEKAVEITKRALKFSAGVGSDVMLLCGYVTSNPNTPAKKENLLAVVKAVEPTARKLGVLIALELPLPANELAELVDRANSDHVGIYYDFGNAVALGFDPVAEVGILGSRILALHVKDSGDQLGGLHFGKGRLKLNSAMKAIKSIGYDGWVMVETFGDDEAETRLDLEKVRRLM